MTIGLVLDDTLDKSDGVQAAVLSIGRELSTRGHNVHYIVAQTNRTDLANVHSLSNYFEMKFNGNSVRTPKAANKKTIKRLFNDIHFDVLHVQMPYSPLLAGRVIDAAPSNTRVVGTFHILPYGLFSAIGTKLLGLRVRSQIKHKFSHFFAVSEPAMVFMKKTYGVKSTIVANPIDYNFYHKFQKKVKNAQKQLVFVGRFDERKGVKELVRAYNVLPKTIKNNTQLTMCGKGPLWQEIQDYAKEHKLGIQLPGFVSEDEKARLLSQADVAVFPSTGGESFGIVLAEAMAAGAKVTIAGNNPGYRSVMYKWPETLFNPKNTAEFSNTLKRALEASFAKAISSEQHEYVKQFDVRKIVSQLEENYLQ